MNKSNSPYFNQAVNDILQPLEEIMSDPSLDQEVHQKLSRIKENVQDIFQNNQPPAFGENSTDNFIQELRNYVFKNLDTIDLNGDKIGRHLGISRVHLHRKLKEQTNQSTSEFIKKIRLEKAHELLKKGDFNISEIANKTGFSSISHFSRSFKSYFGTAPSRMEEA